MGGDGLRNRGRRVWLPSALTLMGSALFVTAIGVRTGVGVAVYLPMALVFGVVLAGIPLAYLLPGRDQNDDDDPVGG